jgi:hypothetical protein
MLQVQSSNPEEAPDVTQEVAKHYMSAALDSLFPGLSTAFDATDAAIEMQNQHEAVAPPIIAPPVQAPVVSHDVPATKRKLLRR